MTTALSARNPKVQRLRRLSASRAEREAEGVFVVEGRKLVAEAVAAGAEVEAFFATPDAAAGAPAGLAPVHVLDERALRGALDTTTPQGIAAVVARPATTLDRLDAGGAPVLVLSGVGDPGNAGTLLRSAEATGCAAVVLCDGSVDPFSPKCVRASAGSIFRVPVVSEGEGVDVLQRLGARGLRRLGTDARRGDAPEATDLTAPFALVLGSEAHGLPAPVDGLLDGHVRIPMAGRVESLNVGVAGSIVLFEAARQRRVGAA